MTFPNGDLPDLEEQVTGVAADTGVVQAAPRQDVPVPEGFEFSEQAQLLNYRNALFAEQERQDRDTATRINGVPEIMSGFGAPPPMTRTRVVNGFAVPDINPDAFDPANYPAPSVDIAPQVQAQIDRINIFSVAAQESLGIGEIEARTIGRRLEAMSAEQPWIRDLIFSDFQTAAALSETDAVMARHLPGFRPSDTVYRALADMISEHKNRVSTIHAFEFANETVERGSWLREDLDLTATQQDLAEAGIEALGKTGAVYTNPDTIEFRHYQGQADSFLDRIRHSDVETIETTYDEESRRMVASINYVDGETAKIDVVLDEGTEITNESALRELFVAWKGYGHTVNRSDELRGPQTLLGKGFERLGDVGRAYDRVNAPVNVVIGAIGSALDSVLPDYDDEAYVLDWRSSYYQQQERNEEMLDRMVASTIDSFDREDAIAAVTNAMAAEYGPEQVVLAAGSSIGFVDDMSDQELGEFTAELLQEDELREQFEHRLDDRSTLKRFLDDTIASAAQLGALYDQGLHYFGTHGLALGRFAWDAMSSQDIGEDWERFKDNWERANEAQYLSEYWGWEGPSATTLDVVASIGFDPFTWVTPGGKGLIQVARTRLATKAGAKEAMRLPTTQRLGHMVSDAVIGLRVSDDVAEKVAATASRNALDYIPELYGVSSKTKVKLVGAQTADEVRGILNQGDLRQLAGLTRGMDPQHRLALARANSHDEVMQILEDALPANGGTFLMNFDGHVAVRNTAMNISAASRIFDKFSPRVQEWFRRSLGTFRQERFVGLSPLDFMDDVEEMIFAVFHKVDDADVASEWLETLWRTYDEWETPIRSEQRALREAADDLKQSINSQIAGTPSDVVRFGRRRDEVLRLEQRVREIDNRLGGSPDDLLFHGSPDAIEGGALREGGLTSSADEALEMAGESGTISSIRRADLPERLAGSSRIQRVGVASDQIAPELLDDALRLADGSFDDFTREAAALEASARAAGFETLAEAFGLDSSAGLEEIFSSLRSVVPEALPTTSVPVSQFRKQLSEAKALSRERRIITEGADELDALVAERRRIRARPIEDRPAGWEQRVDDIKKLEQEYRKVGVLRMSSTDDAFRSLDDAHRVYREARASATKQRERLSKLVKKSARPGSRDSLAKMVDDLIDDLGNRLGLEYRPDGKTSSISGRRLHDWSPVTGEGWEGPRILTDTADVSENLRTLARRPDGSIDEQLFAQLQSIGAGSQQGIYRLPASPMEIVAYQANPTAPWWKAKSSTPWGDLNLMQKTTRSIGNTMNVLNRMFSSAVLINLRTIVRSNLDEPIRHMIQTGVLGQTRSRAIGVTAHGLERANIPGGLQGAVDQMLPGQAKRLVGSRPGFVGDWAASYNREMLRPGGIDRASARGYRIVAPGERGFVDAGRFWINGFALNDPVVRRAWAAIGFDDVDHFMSWWDEMGHQYRRSPVVRLEGGGTVPTTAQTAYDAAQNSLDLLVSHWPKDLQGQARAALLKAAREGGDVPPSLLRKISKPMPGAVMDDIGTGGMNRVANWMFDAGYGRPGARRGSLMLQQYQADALEILWEAKESQGRILTPRVVAEKLGIDEDEAMKWIQTPSEDLEWMLRDGGYYLPQQLAEISYRWARDKVNNIMYQTGAGSLFGQKFQKFYPFGRATMDYNTFFAQRLTDTLEFGLNPTVARSMQTVRHPARTIEALRTPGARVSDEVPLGALGRTWQPGIMGNPIPFNARLAGRIGALYGAASTQVIRQQDADPEARLEPQGPLALMDQITFAPVFPGENFIMDFGPGLGPMPAFAVHLLPAYADDSDSVWQQMLAKVRDIAEDLQPTLEYDDRQYMFSDPAAFARGLTGYIVPDSSSSIRGFTENLVLSRFAGSSDSIESMLDWMGEPTGFRRVWKSEFAALLEREGFIVLNSERHGEALDSTMQDALRETAGEAFANTLRKWGAAWLNVDQFDHAHVEHYTGLVEELDGLHAAGLIGDSQRDELRDFAAAAEHEGATITEILAYADAAANLLFDLDYETQSMMLVKHPGLVVNLVSGSQCRMESGSPIGPSEFCRPDGRLRLPFGQEGRAVLDRGRAEGWIEARSYGDMSDDMLNRLGGAFRTASTMLWENITTHQRQTSNGLELRIPTWPGRSTNSNFPKYLKETAFPLNEQQIELAETMGIKGLESGMTGAEIADIFADNRDRWAANVTTNIVFETPAIATLANNSLRENDEFGAKLLETLRNLDKNMEDRDVSFDEVPADDQEQVRNMFKIAINRGLLTHDEYAQDLSRVYGPLNYVTPSPPPLAELGDDAFQFTADRDRIEVIDGDTLKVDLGDERVRVRLIGVNAQDYHSVNSEINDVALEHAENLTKWLDNADEISFAIWQPEQFGSIREEVNGEVRYLLWLYVDGEAVFDEDAFNFRNPSGASRTGNGVPIYQGEPQEVI